MRFAAPSRSTAGASRRSRPRSSRATRAFSPAGSARPPPTAAGCSSASTPTRARSSVCACTSRTVPACSQRSRRHWGRSGSTSRTSSSITCRRSGAGRYRCSSAARARRSARPTCSSGRATASSSRRCSMRVEPAAALVGAAGVPGNKGSSQRAALLGAVADGESRIRGFGRAADTLSAADAARALGAEVIDNGDDDIRVRGVGLRGLRSATIDCGNAGTVLRLLCGLLVGQRGERFELVGDASLTMRPHERAAAPLRQMGARIETTEGHAPVKIEGADLQSITYELPVASAQVKSAVLLAGLFAGSGPTTVIEPHPTRDHTERMLQSLNVRLSRTERSVSVWPVESLPPLDVDIPGDISSAAPLIVAAVLLNGSELILHNVNVNPLRTGMLTVLERMGARVAVFNRRTVSGERVADLEVRSTPLVATTVEAAEVPRLVDELPLVALLGAFGRGTTVVRGAEELRAKETDRIETVVDSLRAIGVRIEAKPDGFVVRGTPARPRGGRINASGDHRIAMLGGIAGLVSREGVDLQDADSVGVSFPGFFDLLEQLAQR